MANREMARLRSMMLAEGHTCHRRMTASHVRADSAFCLLPPQMAGLVLCTLLTAADRLGSLDIVPTCHNEVCALAC